MSCCLVSKYQLGVQIHTVRDYFKTPADIRESLKKISAIGYKLVQVGRPACMSPAELLEACREAGVAIAGIMVSYENWINRYDEELAFLRAIDCRYAAIAWIGTELRNTGAAWADTAEKFNTLGRRLASDGITLQYHNHKFEFEKFDGRTGLEILYSKTAPDYLQAQLDTCWLARGAADPVKWIMDMAGRTDQIHLKDTVIKDNKELFAEIGEGNLHWHAILRACKKAGVKHYIVEQDSDWRDGDPFKSLAISYEYLTKNYDLI